MYGFWDRPYLEPVPGIRVLPLCRPTLSSTLSNFGRFRQSVGTKCKTKWAKCCSWDKPYLRLHLGKRRFGVGGDLLVREVLFVRRNRPLMAEGIFHLAVNRMTIDSCQKDR